MRYAANSRRRFFLWAILVLAIGIAATLGGGWGLESSRPRFSTLRDLAGAVPLADHGAPAHLIGSLTAAVSDDANDDDAQLALMHIAEVSSSLRFHSWILDRGAECRATLAYSSPTRGPPAIL